MINQNYKERYGGMLISSSKNCSLEIENRLKKSNKISFFIVIYPLVNTLFSEHDIHTMYTAYKNTTLAIRVRCELLTPLRLTDLNLKCMPSYDE